MIFYQKIIIKKKVMFLQLILNKIPNNLKKYFFRGYFDGDGSIYKYEKYYQVGLNITSTYGIYSRFI